MENPFFAPVEDEPVPAPKPAADDVVPGGAFLGLFFALLFQAIAFVIGAIIFTVYRLFPIIRLIFG
jgi:hypothetical protein